MANGKIAMEGCLVAETLKAMDGHVRELLASACQQAVAQRAWGTMGENAVKFSSKVTDALTCSHFRPSAVLPALLKCCPWVHSVGPMVARMWVPHLAARPGHRATKAVWILRAWIHRRDDGRAPHLYILGGDASKDNDMIQYESAAFGLAVKQLLSPRRISRTGSVASVHG